ncbi:MerR family transcriptional regulator [Alkalimarinus coralli]|uniref:MerR family transcriptional regulator n=1 Tax=Alkalimarinus coralli TaxID=2935863 RepID=UPI00202B68B2|nr:MerR family transcriptional regulator [Alkalimarinus coralli]
MRVNELSKRAGVTSDTVRYYTRIGLLTPSKERENGYKNYNTADEKRLHFIIKSRHLGFSIVEIQEIINMSSTGNSPCCRVREVVKKRLNDAQQSIEELQQLYQRLKRAAATWETMPDGEPTGDSVCSLIEMWEEIELGEASLQKVSSLTP